jgi:hypothetical protein
MLLPFGVLIVRAGRVGCTSCPAQGERWTTVAGVGREVERDTLLEVVAAAADVQTHLATYACSNPVSKTAAANVLAAAARLAR